MIYYNGKWLIELEIKAELDRLHAEIERLERENAVLRGQLESRVRIDDMDGEYE